MKVNIYWIVIYILLLSIILLSCKKTNLILHNWVTYKIKKGHNSSTVNVEIFPKNNSLKFKAKFNNSCVYNCLDISNQIDINKLFGFSDCGSPHHENSARFGWNWYNGKLNIYSYTYNEGVPDHKYITSIDIDQEYEYEIVLSDGRYTFNVDGKSIDMNRGCNKGLKYLLYPYFGGTEKAPQDIEIAIKII